MRIRTVLIGLALLVGAVGAWLTASELLHPGVPYFPANRSDAEQFAGARATLGSAAQTGLVRGELWTDYALALAADGGPDDPASPADAASARQAAERAVRLAPHDARAWLLLADLDQRAGEAARGLAALKMSYLTGRNDATLAPTRIGLLTTLPGAGDEDIQTFAAYEIQMMARDKGTLALALPAIYRAASPAGKRLLDRVLALVDSSILENIRAGR